MLTILLNGGDHMPHTVKIHGEETYDEKLVRECIKHAPECVKIEFVRTSQDDPKDGFSGALMGAPSGLYKLIGPPASKGRWNFNVVVKNGRSAAVKYIIGG